MLCVDRFGATQPHTGGHSTAQQSTQRHLQQLPPDQLHTLSVGGVTAAAQQQALNPGPCCCISHIAIGCSKQHNCLVPNNNCLFQTTQLPCCPAGTSCMTR